MAAALLILAAPFVLMGGAFAAWVQHLYTCFTTQAWGFLIAGAIAPPIGIIHGVGVWLGAWG